MVLDNMGRIEDKRNAVISLFTRLEPTNHVLKVYTKYQGNTMTPTENWAVEISNWRFIQHGKPNCPYAVKATENLKTSSK